jgi:hypothetical protein
MTTSYYRDIDPIFRVGNYFNLVIPESSGTGISAYHIDEIDALILSSLGTAKSIRTLLADIEVYFEDDVIQYNWTLYKNMIISASKELVKKKAINSALTT